MRRKGRLVSDCKLSAEAAPCTTGQISPQTLLLMCLFSGPVAYFYSVLDGAAVNCSCSLQCDGPGRQGLSMQPDDHVFWGSTGSSWLLWWHNFCSAELSYHKMMRCHNQGHLLGWSAPEEAGQKVAVLSSSSAGSTAASIAALSCKHCLTQAVTFWPLVTIATIGTARCCPQILFTKP